MQYRASRLSKSNPDNLTGSLNAIAAEGWELFHIWDDGSTMIGVFQREGQPDVDSDEVEIEIEE